MKKDSAISYAEDRFRVLFEHSSDAHLIFADGGIIDCNEATVRLLKCRGKEDVLNLHPSVLSPEFQPDGIPSAEKAAQMDRLAREKGFHRFEWVHQTSTGEPIPVQVTLNAVHLDGKPAMIAVWHDLTELKLKEERLRTANETLKKELEAAAQIQQSLLPVSSPRLKGFRAAWAYRPTGDLGGDIFNVFPLDEEHAGLYILDVTGHGVPASLLSVAASHFLSPFSDSSFVRVSGSGGTMKLARPYEVAERLNQHFSANPAIRQFFTLLYGIIHVETLEFCYICAGHPLPIVVSRDNRVNLLSGSGFPVGIEQNFKYSEICLKLKPGDRIYMYSDGLTEARNPEGELFGTERLMRLTTNADAEPIADSIEKILSEINRWCGPDGPEDDLSLLVCEVTPCRPWG